MENDNVLNLIRKFEQLTNEISPSDASKSTASQKATSNSAEIQTKMSLFMAPMSDKKVESPVKHGASGWNYNPLADVEKCVRTIKNKINSIAPTDDKSMLMIFMEMMDTLIKLSSIDTDGLKTQKVKKQCCLMELRNIKDTIREWIDPSVDVVECSDEIEVEVVDQKESKPNEASTKVTDSKEKVLSIKALTEKFDNCDGKQGKVEHSETRSNGVKFASSNPCEEDQISTRKPQPRRPVDISDILSELKYYNEIIADIDPEDYIRMESIEEYLMEIAPYVKSNVPAEKNVQELLRQLDVLKTGQALNNGKASNPTENSSLSIIIEVPESTTGSIDELAETEKDLQSTEPPISQSAKVVEVVIPDEVDVDEHLRLSKEQLEQYKVLMQSYLINNDERDLIQYEHEIAEHYEYLTHFVPHRAVLASLKELTQGYRDLLDLINDAKFKIAYKDNVSDNNNSQDALAKLKVEISRYYDIIETIDLNIPVNVDTLRTNLQDVLEELEELPDGGQDRNEAVADIHRLANMLEDKLKQSTDI